MPFLVSASAARSGEGEMTRTRYILSRQRVPRRSFPQLHSTAWSEAPCVLVSSSVTDSHFYFDWRFNVPLPINTTNSNPPHKYIATHTASPSPHPKGNTNRKVTGFSLSSQSHSFALAPEHASLTRVLGTRRPGPRQSLMQTAKGPV